MPRADSCSIHYVTRQTPSYPLLGHINAKWVAECRFVQVMVYKTDGSTTLFALEVIDNGKAAQDRAGSERNAVRAMPDAQAGNVPV